MKSEHLFLRGTCLCLRRIQSQGDHVRIYELSDELPGEAEKERKRRIISSRSELKRDALQPSPIPITCAITSWSSGLPSMYIPHRH